MLMRPLRTGLAGALIWLAGRLLHTAERIDSNFSCAKMLRDLRKMFRYTVGPQLVVVHAEDGRRQRASHVAHQPVHVVQVAVERLFHNTCERLGLNRDDGHRYTRENTFRRPTDKGGQLRLF